MADIRIKDLAVTAGSSASDDYLAVDGSTNGTRKLNAYSPTFGGNLTVSGLTTSAGVSNSGALTFTAAAGQIAGSIAKNATYGLTYYGVTGSSNDNTMLNASGAVVLSNPAGTTNATLSGNLTVSGGGTNVLNGPSAAITTSGSGVAGTLCLTESPTSGAMLMMGTNGGNHAYVQMTNSSNLAAAYPIALNPNGGNVLIGTLTDVSAKVYSKVADGVLSFGAAGTTKGIRFAHASTYSSIDGVDSSLSGSYQPLQINGSTVQIATNGGTVAASFDTSQNATFVGHVDVKKDLRIYGSNASSAGAITADSAAGGLYFYGQGTSTGMRFYTTDGAAASKLALTIDSSQRCILAGALRLNNAYTAGAPTATGYVTIEDSAGNTYKVLVGT